MRILQLTNKPPWPARDGGAIAMLNLTRGFVSHGHEVTVLAMNTLKHHTSHGELPPELKQKVDFHFVEVDARISPIGALTNLLFSSKPYNAARFISKDYTAALTKLLQDRHFDVVQLEGLYLCPYIPVIRQLTGVLIVYREHNIEHEIWQRSAQLCKPGPRKWYLHNLAARIKKFETSWLNSYDLVVPITQRDNDLLNAMGNTRVSHVSPTGIDVADVVSLPNFENGVSLFHLGSLDWPPNQEGLLWFLDHCWPAVSDRFPTLRFYIAGRNAPAWLVHKLNVQDVVYEGEVADAAAFMQAHTLMVVPLLSGSGMRIKIIEGMALGKAIVSTSVGAEGLNVENRRHLLVADGPENFTRALTEALSNQPFIEELGRNAVDFARQNFDNTTISGQLARFYQNHLP